MIPLKKDRDAENIIEIGDYINIAPAPRNKKKPIKAKGTDSEVFPFRTEEEIQRMIDVFDSKINNNRNVANKIACRNKLLFIIGINTGLRASDLRSLKWEFFMEYHNGKLRFKEYNRIQPKKTAKKSKFVTIYFNNEVKIAIKEYLIMFQPNSIEEYIFMSRKDGTPITEIALGAIIKQAAKEADIRRNINSHSLRKTFGLRVYNHAKDKTRALVELQKMFNHATTITTMKYIGILDSDMEKVFKGIGSYMDEENISLDGLLD